MIITDIAQIDCIAEETFGKTKGIISVNMKDVAPHSKDTGNMDSATTSFGNDGIVVFTPKGKGIILPKEATALDFAYKIHSKIGQHAVNARINGQLMSVKTVLNYGDCVEIDTDENARPGADWMNHVRTKSAKRHLRNYILSVLNNEYKPCPHCHPLPGDKVIGFKADDGYNCTA